ncbi:MAG: hypothetical protein B0D92_07905 [Spirochaeta sp. LUC14_002_19_P3]|nr:MAG: hypothetical protein B0D92_07905 [Spirochaeta sp. LUC14_002_19_P3]
MTAKDFIRNFDPNREPLDETDETPDEFYVPIYEEELTDLRNAILASSDKNSLCLGITGQSGTGKSTALKHLATEEINTQYEVLHFNFNEYLSMDDVQMADVLLMFGFLLAKENESLQKRYFDKLDKLQRVVDGTLIEETTTSDPKKSGQGREGGIGIELPRLLRLNARLFTEYKHYKESRTVMRETVRPQIPELCALLNEMITQYMECSQKKPLLIYLDGLEHIRNKESIEQIFGHDYTSALFGLKCFKIVTLPISATTYEQVINRIEIIVRFILCLKPNPLSKDVGMSDKIQQHKKCLRDIYSKRSGEDIIDSEALDKAIDYSGGIIRQFFEILTAACIHAYGSNKDMHNSLRLSETNIDAGVRQRRQMRSAAIISGQIISVLNTIRTQHKPTGNGGDEDLFIKLLQLNQIVAYNNGEMWYEVNPLIENTVKVYAEP